MEFRFDIVQPIDAHYTNVLIIEADTYEEAEAIVSKLNEEELEEYLEDEVWGLEELSRNGSFEIYYEFDQIV